jgi:glycolate oxidase FAD binding subunit
MTVLEPATAPELAAELKRANDRGLALMPRGGGTKADWGNPAARCDAILSTARLNRVIEHAWSDMTVTVEAGCTLAQLQCTLAEHGQRLAVDALWPERATIGGILSANDTGALRLSFGGLRDLIIGVTLALPDGTLAVSGGKVVKNVAGYDLPKLVTGALGTLGVITQAVFRIHPLPRYSRTLTMAPRTLEEAQNAILAIQASQLAHAALQLRASSGELALDLLIEGTEAGIAAQEAAVRDICGPAEVRAGGNPWTARQSLWEGEAPVVKISILPAGIARAIPLLGPGAAAVIQGNGLGTARLNASAAQLRTLRSGIEALGGSLTILRQPEPRIDAWSSAGDALPLMLALKQQFDPKGTLNPGRFVGGI